MVLVFGCTVKAQKAVIKHTFTTAVGTTNTIGSGCAVVLGNSGKVDALELERYTVLGFDSLVHN